MLPKKLYLFLSIGLLVGYIWIGLHTFNANKENEKDYPTCIIKTATGYPCPACGSSRAVYYMSQGNLKQATLINPFGVLMGFLMAVLPIWMIFDWISRKKTLYNAYLKIEAYFKNKWVMSLFIIIVIANWIWNIYKGL